MEIDDVIEEKLIEIGKKLAPPPSDAHEIIKLLEELILYVSRIEQSPPQQIWDALQPVMKAVTVKEYLKHLDKDVKLIVTLCVSEITRVTAPDAPFDDDIMKVIFQLIVEAFEELHDMSSHTFKRRATILEIVAKVRLSVVMLDLECDELILDMFHHFLKTIRSDHPHIIFTQMETIMSLVIEESEDITFKLLSDLLDTLKKDNKDVLPIAKRLAQKVMSKSAIKIRDCLKELVESKHILLIEYNEVVTSICQGSSDVLNHKESNSSSEVLEDDSKLSERTVSDELPQAPIKQEEEVTCPEKVVSTSNGNIQMENGESMGHPSSPKQKSECSRGNVISKGNNDNSESVAAKQVGSSNTKKSKSRKTNSSVKKDTPVIHIDNDKIKSRHKETDSSQAVDTSAMDVESEKKHDNPTENQLNSSQNKSQSVKKAKPKTSKGRSRSKTAGKKSDTCSDNEATPLEGDESKEAEDGDDVMNESEVKTERNSGKKGQAKRKLSEKDLSESKQKSNAKKQKKEDTSGKDLDAEPTLKELISLHRSASKTPVIDQTPRAKLKSKRMQAVDTEDTCNAPVDESLVGSKIKVWWPDDEMFYDGVVDSYDPASKKHTIAYDDGETEILLLKKERFEIDKGDSKKDNEKAQKGQNAEGSSSKTSRTKTSKSSSNTTSKETKLHTQSKSGKEPSDRDASQAKGKSKGETPTAKLSSNKATTSTSKKSKGKSTSSDKSKTPKTSIQLKENAENESPKTSKKSKDETSKSGKKSKNETPKSATPKADSNKSKTSTPKTASRSEVDESNKNKTTKTKPKTNSSTPKSAGGSSIENGNTSAKGKSKVEENESTPTASEGKATSGGKKRNRKGGRK